GNRSGVDDDAVFVVVIDGRLLGHLLGAQAHHVEGTDQVDVDRAHVFLERERTVLAEGLGGSADAGAVDVDVHGAELGDGSGDTGLHRFFVGDVHFDEQCVVGTEFFNGFFAPVFVQVEHDDLGAFLDEEVGSAAAEAGYAAGDNGNFTFQFHDVSPVRGV